MKHKEGMIFQEMRAGTTIQKVPLVHLIFWTALNRPRSKKWLLRMKQIKEFLPVYYCKKCRQLEDGAHRIRALRERGEKSCDVAIHNKCIHKNSGYLGILEAAFMKFKNRGMKFKPLDFAWIRACRDKWRIISKHVNFKGKTVLDVGCQSGYSPLEAVRRGARKVIGIENRQSIIDVGRFAISQLNLQARITLKLEDWALAPCEKHDIVICMGLLHYFPINEYERLFNKLLDSTRETLIIEMRLFLGDRIDIIEHGTQTIPSEGWLDAHANTHGFSIKTRAVRKLGKRELWILVRK